MNASPDYMADCREAQGNGHHPDCDGYMTSHRVTLVPTRHESRTTWVANCDECGPLHIGSFGQERDAAKSSAGHSSEIACDHRCLTWNSNIVL